MSRADKFFQMCTVLPFEEQKDSRDENTIPEIVHIAELRDQGNMQDAIDYGKALIKMYPDFDLIPFMLGYIYYQKDFPQEAFQVAVDAIPRCPRRYRLYSVAGLAEFKRNHVPEALVWWARSVVAQCSIVDFQEADPFLYLGQAAEVVGAKREAEMMYTMCDAIERDRAPLGPEVTDVLAELRESWAKEPLIRVLKLVDERYLHAK
jgi:hypothetical protein